MYTTKLDLLLKYDPETDKLQAAIASAKALAESLNSWFSRI